MIAEFGLDVTNGSATNALARGAVAVDCRVFESPSLLVDPGPSAFGP